MARRRRTKTKRPASAFAPSRRPAIPIGTAYEVAAQLGVTDRLMAARRDEDDPGFTALAGTQCYTHSESGAWGRAYSDEKRITIKPILWRDPTYRDDLVQVFLHECAHVIADWRSPRWAKHGKPWRDVMVAMGCEPAKYAPRRRVTPAPVREPRPVPPPPTWRFLAYWHDAEDCERRATAEGWDGTTSLMDFAHPEERGWWTMRPFPTLHAAADFLMAECASGRDFFGQAEVREMAEDGDAYQRCGSCTWNGRRMVARHIVDESGIIELVSECLCWAP